MKALLSLLILGIGVNAGGAADLLKITAFYPLNGTKGVSELCGKVSGQVLVDYRIVITSDPKFNPGKYTTLPGPDGVFCMLINSDTGTANVELVKMGATSRVESFISNVTTKIR
jgi:hypothetical protein